ncbi:MAG: HD domain-containing protein [Saprospiraceae bacterium]
MTKLTLQEKAENYISDLFLEANTSGLFYHDFNHTLSVVKAVDTIAKAISLSDKEREILIVAAWFHDIGYLYTRTEHEAFSIKITKQALNPNHSSLIKPVTTCIAATKVGEKPQTYLAALLKDADIAFGSAYDFLKTNNAYREELRISENKIFDDTTWRTMSLNFLKNVVFFSDYGKTYFAPLVANNLKKYQTSE